MAFWFLFVLYALSSVKTVGSLVIKTSVFSLDINLNTCMATATYLPTVETSSEIPFVSLYNRVV